MHAQYSAKDLPSENLTLDDCWSLEELSIKVPPTLLMECCTSLKGCIIHDICHAIDEKRTQKVIHPHSTVYNSHYLLTSVMRDYQDSREQRSRIVANLRFIIIHTK